MIRSENTKQHHCFQTWQGDEHRQEAGGTHQSLAPLQVSTVIMETVGCAGLVLWLGSIVTPPYPPQTPLIPLTPPPPPPTPTSLTPRAYNPPPSSAAGIRPLVPYVMKPLAESLKEYSNLKTYVAEGEGIRETTKRLLSFILSFFLLFDDIPGKRTF